MSVTVTFKQWGAPEEGDWDLNFQTGSVKFCVREPHLFSFAQWRAFAKGSHVKRLSFCQGNGDGLIEIVGDELAFVAAPAGGGGDVYLEARVPFAAAAGPLLAALEAAKAAGCSFAKDAVAAPPGPAGETAQEYLLRMGAAALYTPGMSRRDAGRAWNASPHSTRSARAFLVHEGAGALYRDGMSFDEMKVSYAGARPVTV